MTDSKDASWELLCRIHGQDPPRAPGAFSTATTASIWPYSRVLRRCGGQVVVTLDADLQNPPEEVPKLVNKLEEGFDVVSGWRQNRHDSVLAQDTHLARGQNHQPGGGGAAQGLRLHAPGLPHRGGPGHVRLSGDFFLHPRLGQPLRGQRGRDPRGSRRARGGTIQVRPPETHQAQLRPDDRLFRCCPSRWSASWGCSSP